MAIVSVYIEEGCITCDACEETLPEVFHVTDDTCYIKADVRLDGGYDRNEEKQVLSSKQFLSLKMIFSTQPMVVRLMSSLLWRVESLRQWSKKKRPLQ